MLNFFRWTDNHHEVVLEGSSFYFSHKMCIAFRSKGGKKILVRGLRTENLFSIDFIDALENCGKLVYLNKQEFDFHLGATYARALLTGVRREGIERLFNCNPKEIKNVRANKKSDAG